jgi:hypothetical protein
MITFDLARLKEQRESEWGRKITWKEIEAATGLYPNSLGRLLTTDPAKRAVRVDLDTINAFCRFFRLESGPVPFIVYTPDEAAPDQPAELAAADSAQAEGEPATPAQPEQAAPGPAQAAKQLSFPFAGPSKGRKTHLT